MCNTCMLMKYVRNIYDRNSRKKITIINIHANTEYLSAKSNGQYAMTVPDSGRYR